MADLATELAWLDAHLDHESGSVGVAAGQVEGLDLAVMRELVGLLGDPQADVPVIHVTGTNGKGSTAAMLTALLRAHGLSVGSYTSPHLERVNERIRRDGEPIDDVDLAEVLAGVRAVEPMLSQPATWFELVTAAALRWFAEAPVDVAVVEVGLLGRYDATNVVDGRVAVITSIGGDHTDFAPGWEAAVCSEKAGIVRPEATAVLGPLPAELRAVVAAEGPARLWADGVDFEVLSERVAIGGRLLDVQGALGRYEEVFLPLHGSHQAANAAVAIAAVEAFFDRPLDPEVVREGLAAVELQGRVEVVSHQPLVVLDGAHNPDALRALAATVDDEFAAVGARLVVVGQLAGRDPAATADALRALRPDLVVCTTAAEGERGLPAERLGAACEAAGLPTEVMSDPVRAVTLALGRAQEEDLVVVAGSFRLLAPARRALARSGPGTPP